MSKHDANARHRAELLDSLHVADRSVAEDAPSCPPVIADVPVRMAKADVRKPENWKQDIGGCLDAARHALGWTIDQLAAELDRDARQVSRWIAGVERPQIDVVFSVAVLRGPFVVALAQLARCEVETVIRIRRSA